MSETPLVTIEVTPLCALEILATIREFANVQLNHGQTPSVVTDAFSDELYELLVGYAQLHPDSFDEAVASIRMRADFLREMIDDDPA